MCLNTYLSSLEFKKTDYVSAISFIPIRETENYERKPFSFMVVSLKSFLSSKHPPHFFYF